jgi:hypothetical protein
MTFSEHKVVFLDVECFTNYFLICFKSYDKMTVKSFELSATKTLDIKTIETIMTTRVTIGFNSISYDLPMIAYALTGVSNQELKNLSDALITSGKKHWEVTREYEVNIPWSWEHIDLIEPAPVPDKVLGGGFKTGLKMYGARMHVRQLQDLPYDPAELIDAEKAKIIKEYCINDVNITYTLYERIKERLVLREALSKDYGTNLLSKSDAKIAEIVLCNMIGLRRKKESEQVADTEKIYTYKIPKYLKFNSVVLNDFIEKLKNTEFKCDENGAPYIVGELNKEIYLFGNIYTFGLGGLHSTEEHRALKAGDDEFIMDIDVSGCYPTIILNNNFCPDFFDKNVDKNKFIEIYKKLYNERLAAKKAGNKVKSESLKIILNSGFGKFGSRFSALYDPSLLLNITITGQLTLLYMIERISECGFSVLSANTDGIVIKGLKQDLSKLYKLLKDIETILRIDLDHTLYTALYNESVNTYLAIKEDGSVKAKGIYAENGLSKNPPIKVCVEAVIEYLKGNKDILTFIKNNSKDILKFLSIRKCRTAATYKGNYLGKTVRWYYGIGGEALRGTNGHKVADSDGAIPLMTLPDPWETPLYDIDFNAYVAKTYKMLKNLGVQIDA